MNAYAVSDRPRSAGVLLGGEDRSAAAGQRQMQMQPAAGLSGEGLGMKVATMPRSAAIIDSR